MHKEENKKFQIVHYGFPLYIIYEPLNKLLWSRGFIDKNIYLAIQSENQSLFTIEPKKGLLGTDGKMAMPVLFGSEVLIKHTLSGHYISIKEINEIPMLQFTKQQSSACYFEFISLRTFEGKGNPVTTDSLFIIQHSMRKLYISVDGQQNNVIMIEELSSPKHAGRKISREKGDGDFIRDQKRMPATQGQMKSSQIFQSEMEKQEMPKKFKKKKTMITDQVFSDDGGPAPNLQIDISEERNEQKSDQKISISPIFSNKKFSLPEYSKLENLQKNTLILYQPKEDITLCHVQNYPSKEWKIQIADKSLHTPYLENHEFIFFTHSEQNKILTVDIERKPYEIAYEKNPLEGYLSSSIFVVEIEDDESVYLRHYLTGRYFPLNNDPHKKFKLSLIPLLPPKKKQIPPFKLLFDMQQFVIQGCQKTKDFHGFWLNRASKKQIAQIVSFQNVPKQISFAYFINFLKQNTFTGQKLLRECQFIPYIIQKLIPKQTNKNIICLCYKLLFYICKNNAINKKKCIFFIQKILQEKHKDLILDLLTELLGDCSNNYALEKAITPKIIQNQIVEFINKGDYSVPFMRIFRVFCGPEEQPCVRNQSLIFDMFFWKQVGLKSMTESCFAAKKKVEVYEALKFHFFQKENEIYVSNTDQTGKYDLWKKSEGTLRYIRQYLYLLSDCMNNNNYPLIKIFSEEMDRSLLHKLLLKAQMKGPCLSLLLNAYLKPEKKYKPQIFHKDYDKICDKGSLMAMAETSQTEQFRKFIIDELQQNKDYKSTTFRILLNAFKMTIDNGYWKSYQQLLDVSQHLNGIIAAEESISEYHDTYEQKVEEGNMMRSKIVALSIKISLIEIQICLWVSDSMVRKDNEKKSDEDDKTGGIDVKILDMINKNRDWIFNEEIFKLCSTNSPELMRKSLLLMYKIYNIHKLFYKSYGQACIQLKSTLDLTNIFTILRNTKSQLTIQNYFTLIEACVKDVTMNSLNPQNLNPNFRSLESLFKYKQVNEETQNMLFKLGVHEKLLKDIQRYSGLRKKQKNQEAELTYWKLLLLYAIIRNNLKLRDIISQSRYFIINIIETQYISYYVAADIIQQIYRNNRKLIISDTEELMKICNEVTKVISRNQIDLKCCKVVNLLGVFIESGNRKIMQNHQIILKTIFTKSLINHINLQFSQFDGRSTMLDSKLKEAEFKGNDKNEYKVYKDILQVVVYDLLSSMGQKKLLMQFTRPNNKTINSMVLSIGSSNWSLKSKAFSCINFQEKMSDRDPIQFLNLIHYDLNVMCESLHSNLQSQFKQFSKEVKIYISNIRKILSTIKSILKCITSNFSSKLENLESDEVIQIIKVVQKLFILKSMCPAIVGKDIMGLLEYIRIIQDKIKKNSFNDDLIEAIQMIELADFTNKESRDRLPLIFSKKIREKKEKSNRSLYEESKKHVEVAIEKKMHWAKISKQSTNNFKNFDKEMVELQTFLVCLKNVNKADPTVLEDNIKEFLVNFLNTSYLLGASGQKYKKMQDILVKYEIPSVICSFLEEPFKQRYQLFTSTLYLGIKLLEGGHTQCQQKFLTYFYGDAKNMIFQNLYTIIHDSLKTIEFYYKYEEDPTIKSYQMMLEFEEIYICKEQRKLSCKVLSNAFRFLQLLCENDHHQMKEYIYNQTDADGQIKYMSKNFIEIASTALEKVFDILSYNIQTMRKQPDSQFHQQLRRNLFTLPNYILDFLIEVCQIPATQNQLYLCRTDFFNFVKDLMTMRNNCQNDNNEGYIIQGQNVFFLMERKIIILLRSLLEQDSMQIIQLMTEKIGQSEFQFFIQESCVHGGLEDTEKLKQMLTSYKLNCYVENIVDVLIVKKILKFECVFSFNKQKLEIIEELNHRIDSINVNFKGHSMTVYFPSHPLFLLLRKKTKIYLLDRSAKFNTRKEKLTDFILSREMVYQDINEEKNIENKLLNEKKMGYLFNFSLFLSYLIICLLILFYSVGKAGVVLDIYENKIISSLSYMQLLVALLYTIFLGYNQSEVVTKKLKTKQIETDLTDFKVLKDPGPAIVSTRKLIQAIYFGESDSLHSVFLIAISLYACFIQTRVYAFALLFVFAKIEFLESIFKAIKLTWQQLIFVSFFALAFSLIFGFLTIDNYIGPLYQNQDIDIDINRINEHCNTIFTCVSSLYTQKIIGESVSRQEQEYNYRRFISDLIYEAFFNIFLTNIIAAIIIDKFAEQRNVKQKVEHDRYSSCYVCFADKATLQRRGEDYNSHVTHVHNLWNYFYYMYTLENLKDITDFTGIEYWINSQIQSNQIDWIPIDDSLKEQSLGVINREHFRNKQHRKERIFIEQAQVDEQSD